MHASAYTKSYIHTHTRPNPQPNSQPYSYAHTCTLKYTKFFADTKSYRNTVSSTNRNTHQGTH
jgi:hypothetical protein